MVFQLNCKSGKAVYLQLVDQVKLAAASGSLHAGEALPAIRPLAEELRVNRNTVAKAYAELNQPDELRKVCLHAADFVEFQTNDPMMAALIWAVRLRLLNAAHMVSSRDARELVVAILRLGERHADRRVQHFGSDTVGVHVVEPRDGIPSARSQRVRGVTAGA